MSKIKAQPGIMDIALYQGGKSHVDGVENILKLSSNENPFGPSDATKDAMVRASHELHRYPSTDHATLRAAIGDVWGLDPERIICGNGSGEVLMMIAQAFAGRGDEVLFTEHGFAMYPIYANANGAKPVVVAEKNRTVDVDALLAACTKKTKVCYIANPANPTGTMIDEAELARLADGLPKGAVLVLDGAYAEYVEGFDGGKALVESRDNVIMTRTFSKIYGLGGLRIGYGYAPKPIIDVLMRIRGPFNLSAPALAAAETAMRDTAHTEKCRTENAKQREWMAAALADMGLPSDPSSANFILVRFASADEAKACNDHLAAQGILVRYVGGYGLPEGLRITVGDEASCRRAVHAIGQFVNPEKDENA
ncbi:histidinol-phosphate transaminase [Octadecabacter ascidiaceicola]|uniref:Histidinol-phosphate aminotransferase n=1 Tax=Octadecabacter ascidiaceicola TaxID=1655543 RepID=A0A238K420_9RHOB|nr:histidinol-phosphate transaminase [Octadecabacter ascidiaceicola]SMX36852.1 Histidinol-phosphate aminotransferase 2 [Octadecabacter ascidiaceicola]